MDTPKTLLLLGRQNALGLAELESLYGSDAIKPYGNYAATSSLSPQEINFNRLGGSIKLCEITSHIANTNWKLIEKDLLKKASGLFPSDQDGKIHLGLSVYGSKISPLDIHATALRLKKVVRAKTGRSVRVVPNTATHLSSAQVLHHQLTRDNGVEIVICVSEGSAFIARTIAEQDIAGYARRDQNRPKRDARVGMLPPKLAQIILNLGAGQRKDTPPHTVLDPFCGTGVVLQEAALQGFNVYGTDLEPRMISYSKANLEWLQETHELPEITTLLEAGDATVHTWSTTPDIIACEGYLGQPFSAWPDETKLRAVMHTCNQIMKGFLKNIASQIPSGTPLCIALPAWHNPNGSFQHLNLLDDLEELGYNRISFVHVHDEDLLYYRPDQVVARELLVIIRK